VVLLKGVNFADRGHIRPIFMIRVVVATAYWKYCSCTAFMTNSLSLFSNHSGGHI